MEPRHSTKGNLRVVEEGLVNATQVCEFGYVATVSAETRSEDTRKPYRFRAHEAMRTSLIYDLGALPEPDFTHKLWWRGGIEKGCVDLSELAVESRFGPKTGDLPRD